MASVKGFFKAILRFFRRVIDEIKEMVDEATADPVVLAALEADLGVPPGGLSKVKGKQPDTTGIDQYLSSVKPDAEQFVVAVEFIQAYVGFWKAVFEGALQEDPSLDVDELVNRLFQIATVNVIKFRYPGVYYWMRLLGAITQDLRLSVEETFAPDLPANIFKREYWENLGPSYKKGYLRFRLDQAADLLLEPDPNNPPTPEEQTRLDQVGFEVFGWSDLIFLVGLYSGFEWGLKSLLKKINLEMDQIYGWELPPGEDIPLSERIASRGYSLKLTSPAGPPQSSSATLTQFFLVEEDGRFGWYLSLRGAVTFTETAGSEERPLKIKITVNTPDGLDAVVHFSGDDKFAFTGAPTAGMKLSIEPEQPAAVGPAISLPETTGTRLEIGDFSFSVDISTGGFKIKAAAKKSALVIVPDEGDSFVSESLKSKEVRINFDFGIAADQDNGIYVEGGGRLATTIPINKSLGGLRIQSVQLALEPVSGEDSSELQWTAAASFNLKLGPLQIVVEQIGFTVFAGATNDEPPPDALRLLPPLYLRKLGFKPPTGLGILVDSEAVTGGGFIFFDREKEQYAGVLELTIKERLSLKAIGLLTTRLPDGSKGFSLLIIISAEFDPPLQLILGFTLGGVGGLLGINRTVDTNVLREGLHNRTLDAILFPKDPVANAGRLLSTLGSVFPPARGRHLFGVALILNWGTPTLISAELALIIEFGENHRYILLGQLHIIAPRKGKPILAVHLDAIGIWDLDRKEFSLDARLYDSYIAFVTLSGDMALRMREGDDPFFLLSIGGYHPEFAVPPNFPRLERVTVKFADSKNLRLILSGYFAVSSNTRQAGGKFDFFAGFAGFSIEGFIQIDVLWQPDVRFLADFDIKVALKYKGRTLLGAHAVGQFSGPEPKRLKGEVSIDLWLFSVSKSFDKTFGDDRPPAALPDVDPLADLVAALLAPQSWGANLPAGSHMLVSLRKRTDGGVLLHPLGELSVRQQVLPLGIGIDRYGGGVVSGGHRFAITRAFLGPDPVTVLRPVNEFFAPADFIEMSDDEKIARPSFESLQAGVALQPQGLAYGGQDPASASQAAASEMDFDEVIIDANGNTVSPPSSGGAAGVLGGDLAVLAASFGPAARSPLRVTGAGRFGAEGQKFRLQQTGYVVAGVDDLKDAGLNGGQAGGLSFSAARQALESHLKENPLAKDRLQVVAAFAVEESS